MTKILCGTSKPSAHLEVDAGEHVSIGHHLSHRSQTGFTVDFSAMGSC